MNAQILKIIFKKYWNDERLSLFETTALAEWTFTASEQETNYFNKLATINF